MNKKVIYNGNTSMKDTLKKIFKIINNKVYLIGFSAILVIITSIISLKGPLLLGDMTDILIKGISFNKGGISFNIDYVKLLNQLIYIFSLYLIVFILNSFVSIIMSKINLYLGYEIRNKINKKINRLSIAYLDKTLDGDTISLITNDTTMLLDSFYNFLVGILPSFVTIIGTIIIMFKISFKLTLVVVLFIPITFGIIIFIVVISQKYFKIQQEKIAKLNAHIEEMYSNHDIIQTYNGQEKSIEEFDLINDDLYKSAFLSQFLSGLIMPIVTVTNNINYVIISLVGTIMITNGTLTLGNLQSFIQYLNGFHHPLSTISNITTFMQQLKAASDRIFDFLELDEMEDESSFEKFDKNKLKGNIEFRNVNFSYGDKKVLNNISFSVNSGEKVAIVGHTGSGKTTIINLLMKFYNINDGDILIDGKSINKISRQDISNMFTMVLQDTWLFEGTIYENIKFGTDNENISFEEIKKVSKNANAHHFIKTQPDSYNMILNEEISNISVGQKQLLTIARAFLKDSKVLILDEATSSIDSRTEKLVQESMKKLMKDKTTFIIAHRLSTIKDCDKIIYLEDGNIIEMGSHEELLKLNGEYKKLYDSQF